MRPLPHVTIVTGPLGAGKTTLLNRWLASYPRDEVAVIVNEFADVGVDGELLAARVAALVEITGGCVCCTTPASLVRALRDMASRDVPPKRVFIETSGAASPASVVRVITRGGVAQSLELDGVVTVLDATRLVRLHESLLVREQSAYADVIVLSRGDAVSAEARADAEAIVARFNPAARLTWSAQGVVEEGDLDALLARRDETFVASKLLSQVTDAAHDPGIEAVSLVHEGPLDEERFGVWIESQVALLSGRLMRLKGIIAMEGVPMRVVLQGVADHVEVSFGAAWDGEPPKSRLVLIGYGLDRAALTKGFATTTM